MKVFAKSSCHHFEKLPFSIRFVGGIPRVNLELKLRAGHKTQPLNGLQPASMFPAPGKGSTEQCGSGCRAGPPSWQTPTCVRALNLSRAYAREHSPPVPAWRGTFVP